MVQQIGFGPMWQQFRQNQAEAARTRYMEAMRRQNLQDQLKASQLSQQAEQAFQAEQADLGRQFRSEEAEAGRGFQREMAGETRDFQREQTAAGQSFQREQAELDRKIQERRLQLQQQGLDAESAQRKAQNEMQQERLRLEQRRIQLSEDEARTRYGAEWKGGGRATTGAGPTPAPNGELAGMFDALGGLVDGGETSPTTRPSQAAGPAAPAGGAQEPGDSQFDYAVSYANKLVGPQTPANRSQWLATHQRGTALYRDKFPDDDFEEKLAYQKKGGAYKQMMNAPESIIEMSRNDPASQTDEGKKYLSDMRAAYKDDDVEAYIQARMEYDQYSQEYAEKAAAEAAIRQNPNEKPLSTAMQRGAYRDEYEGAVIEEASELIDKAGEKAGSRAAWRDLHTATNFFSPTGIDAESYQNRFIGALDEQIEDLQEQASVPNTKPGERDRLNDLALRLRQRRDMEVKRRDYEPRGNSSKEDAPKRVEKKRTDAKAPTTPDEILKRLNAEEDPEKRVKLMDALDAALGEPKMTAKDSPAPTEAASPKTGDSEKPSAPASRVRQLDAAIEKEKDPKKKQAMIQLRDELVNQEAPPPPDVPPMSYEEEYPPPPPPTYEEAYPPPPPPSDERIPVESSRAARLPENIQELYSDKFDPREEDPATLQGFRAEAASRAKEEAMFNGVSEAQILKERLDDPALSAGQRAVIKELIKQLGG